MTGRQFYPLVQRLQFYPGVVQFLQRNEKSESHGIDIVSPDDVPADLADLFDRS